MASVKLKFKRTQELDDGSHPIILQVLTDTNTEKKSIATLNFSCFEQDWDDKQNLPKDRRLALICQEERLKMEKLLYEGIYEGWTARKITDIYKGKATKDLMFFKYLESAELDNKKMQSTKLFNKTKLNKFKKFLGIKIDYSKNYKGNEKYLNETIFERKDISFDNITHELLKKYRKSLEDEGLNTAVRYVRAIKQVFDYASEEDDYEPKKTPFKKRLLQEDSYHETTQRNLTLEQTKKMFSFSNERSTWESSHKMFKVFAVDFWRCCFLLRGINIIELAMMKPKDVKSGYYQFTRTKLRSRTGKKQRIKIIPEAMEIINRYLDDSNDFVFPIMDNGFDKERSPEDYFKYHNRVGTINLNLQRVSKQIGLDIDFNLTSMSARYTFINLAKDIEVPFAYLQELVGHKNNSTTGIYMDIFPQEKIDEYHRLVIDTVLKDL